MDKEGMIPAKYRDFSFYVTFLINITFNYLMKKKCQVVMLPTEKASKLAIHIGDNKFAPLQDYPYPRFTNGIFQCQHLYITSDEETKDGDWITDGKRIAQVNVLTVNDPNKHLHKKIIATTNPALDLPQIPQSFIEQYIKSYNEGNVIKEVMIEYENDKEYWVAKNQFNPDSVDFRVYSSEDKNRYIGMMFTYHPVKLKLNPDNTIIIHEIEEKTYTRS